MSNFIIIHYGDSEQLLINPDCRQIIFMDYMRQKCQYNASAFIDLLDENGKLANIHKANLADNVKEYFECGLNYIPAMLEKGGEEKPVLKKVRPLLTDWEKKFPQLERKIKILTGELKRKKSANTRGGLDLPRGGKGVDRKVSKDRHFERSGSNMGRPSMSSQSGRFSTAKISVTNTGKSSAASNSGRTSGAGKHDKLAKGKAKKR